MKRTELKYFIGDIITFYDEESGEERNEKVEKVEYVWRDYFGETCKYVRYNTEESSTVIDCLGDYAFVRKFENNYPTYFINKGV